MIELLSNESTTLLQLQDSPGDIMTPAPEVVERAFSVSGTITGNATLAPEAQALLDDNSSLISSLFGSELEIPDNFAIDGQFEDLSVTLTETTSPSGVNTAMLSGGAVIEALGFDSDTTIGEALISLGLGLPVSVTDAFNQISSEDLATITDIDSSDPNYGGDVPELLNDLLVIEMSGAGTVTDPVTDAELSPYNFEFVQGENFADTGIEITGYQEVTVGDGVEVTFTDVPFEVGLDMGVLMELASVVPLDSSDLGSSSSSVSSILQFSPILASLLQDTTTDIFTGTLSMSALATPTPEPATTV
ncbi:MAG: hypothetical protein WA919_19620 [Coleofasciculaceae cyanobacterium]